MPVKDMAGKAVCVEVYMSRTMKKFGFSAALLLTVLITSALFYTCGGGTLGFGDPVDFEPPILTLDPGPNPRYVNLNTVISGTAVDNIAVTRVICRDAIDSKIIYGQAKITGNRWSMTMNFTEADNGRRIPAEIVAFDRMENAGERSFASITLVVDIHPPIFDELMIWRNPSRTWPLEDFSNLSALETSDPRGERSENVDRYQNGTFWLRSEITENETAVKSIVLNIYEVNHDTEGEELYSYAKDTDSSIYSPQWTVKEKTLIDAGDAKGWLVNGRNFTQRLENGERIYFRVSATAQDMSSNEGIWRDDFGYFCLYRYADTPKAVLGGGVGQFVDVRTPLPVEIFDDDNVRAAYVDLLNLDDFNNFSGANDRAKVETIKKILRGETTGPAVENYLGDPIENRITAGTTPEYTMVNVIAGEGEQHFGQYMLIGIVEDVKSEPHITGDDTTRPDSIWGYYYYPINVTDNNSPLIVVDTVNTTITTGYDAYDPSKHPGNEDGKITAAGTGNSPEENTFPKLLVPPTVPTIPPFTVTEPGRYFTINGYTLRANKNYDPNVKVTVLKMAWIPYDNGNQDSYLDDVKNALRSDDWTVVDGKVAGVQRWTFSETENINTSHTSYWVKGTDQLIGAEPGIPGSGTNYTKQAFFKRFDILGVQSDGTTPAFDDLNTSYRNFYVNGARENAPKLFVFYALDQDNHDNYRTIRLLGNTTPPALQVYDFTRRDELSLIDSKIPIDSVYHSDIQQDLYKSIRGQGDTVSSIGGTSISPALTIPAFTYNTNDDSAESFMAYSSDQVHKIYVTAIEGDDTGIQISDIKMYNITNESAGPTNERGYYNDANRDLTYIENLPDILQRTFLFEATNRLGVKAQLQRTVAVTSTAQLREIIADKPSGIYGAGTAIKLQAQFTAPVRVKTSGASGPVPKLNIRYEVPSGTAGSVVQDGSSWIYTTVNFSGTPVDGSDPKIDSSGYSKSSLYLDFDWVAPAGARGVLETIDITNRDAGSVSPDPVTGAYRDRVIDLNGAQIIDAETIQYDAFLPGYLLTDWYANRHSLQGNGTSAFPGKRIELDGIRPVLTAFVSGGKTAYNGPEAPPAATPEPANHYYFRAGETITFTLTAEKPNTATTTLRTSGDGNPRIRFRIRDAYTNTVYPSTSTYYYADYSRPAGSNSMLFTIDVNSISLTPPGQLQYGGTVEAVGMDLAQGGIVDTYGNKLINSGGTELYQNDLTITAAGTQIVIDKTAPPDTTPRLKRLNTETGFTPSSVTVNTMNYQPILTLNGVATTTQEPWNTITQYSLDGGVSWADYPTVKSGWTNLDGTDLKIYSTDDSKGSQWQLRTRQLDKAGNESAMSPIYELDIKGVFPKLIYISCDDPAGIYTQGPITFKLDFDAPVQTTLASGDANRAYIIVADTVEYGNSDAKYTAKVYAQRQTTPGDTLTFIWDPIVEKQMPNGLTIMEIHLNGDVVDLYNNLGVNSYDTALYGPPDTPSVSAGKVRMYLKASDMPGTMTPAEILAKTYEVTNLNGSQIEVLTIPPKLTAMYPNNGATASDESNAVMGMDTTNSPDNKTITLIFDENVQKDIGTIYIKPYGQFPVPPVFPVNGYENDDGEWIDGFNEIYNSANLTATQRSYLRVTGVVTANWPAAGGSIVTDDQGTHLTTGMDFGPYKLTTHGLVKGAGYSGSATPNTTPPATTGYDGATAGWNAMENSADPYMVPDITPKYVLDYQYTNNSTGTVVTNIRTALNAAHFRWRVIDVVSPQVIVSGNKVTIKLDVPLPKGFRWSLFYDFGTFTDKASNKVLALGEDTYWFWTDGIQPPVIRVNRMSVDYGDVFDRTFPGVQNGIPKPNDLSLGTMDDTGGTDSVGIGKFTTAEFRVETETPGASVYYGTSLGGPNSSMEVNAYTGNIPGSNPATNWDTRFTSTSGTWIRSNLLIRAGTSGSLVYKVTNENGMEETRTGTGNYWGLRSYNADAKLNSVLNTITLGTTPAVSGSIALGNLKASKNYVAAQAKIKHGTASEIESDKSYEGIFKTVVLLNTPNASNSQTIFNNHQGSSPQLLRGSNNLNPTPSIPGFPLMLQSSDLRFVKVPQIPSLSQFIWMTTEIVSPVYFQFMSCGNNSSIFAAAPSRYGDVGAYVSGSYGDLTYNYNFNQ